MLPDREFVGGIPVVVSLAEEDVLHPTDRPAPAAFVLPRTTMLIAVVRDLLQLFRPYAAALHPEQTQVWFSVGDAPVSWLYPAGVIKDYVNECTREARLAQYASAMTSSSSPAAASSTSPAAASSTLVQSLPLSVHSEPLDLTFHIHSITKGSVRAGAVPLYVNYDRLDEHIRMEIKQTHKAAYTCLYGNYTHYQREAETTLLPAIGLALYRPFDEGAQQQLQEQRFQSLSGAGGNNNGATTSNINNNNVSLGGLGPRGRYQNATADFASPFLLLQYQQLLHGVLAPRPHVAYLLRVGFPYAYRGAASQFETGHLQYEGHRVTAAPALAWPAAKTSSNATAPSLNGAESDASAPSPAAAPHVLVDAEQLPFGLLLWRLFRLPVLRWLAQQQIQPSSNRTDTGNDASGLTEAQRTYQHLLRSLAGYYADAPASATERLAEQEPLLTGTPPEPPAWADWEQTMSAAFVRDYELGAGAGAGAAGGLPFLVEGTAAVVGPTGQPRRIRFEVQGIQPPLATPGSFLEAHLASSDRAIFVTVQVL